MKAEIILGCEGRQDKGFYFCEGVENVILDLEAIRRTEGYLELIKYLDGAIRIFNAPCCKSHIVSNAVYKIHSMGYISEERYKLISYFYELHKRCGIILWAQPKEE